MNIVIISDPTSQFASRAYYLHRFVPHWLAAGHTVSHHIGPDDAPNADLAILHVDLSVVPQGYVEACAQYQRVINGAALDIRKRTVSRNLVAKDDAYDGQVIVKTDLNYGGLPEAAAAGLRRPKVRYGVFAKADVTNEVWADPALVVEKFLPETDARGFWVRTWTFLGDQDRAARYLGGQEYVVKHRQFTDREPCEVPDALRAERARLGFDFGKFDFVVHNGTPVLLDASRTPGSPGGAIGEALAESDAVLASGIGAFL